MSNQDPVSYLTRSLAIYEKVLGPLHHHAAQSLNNLATLYQEQNKYDQAEPLYRLSVSTKKH